MGLFKRLRHWAAGTQAADRRNRTVDPGTHRICRFETMEPRRMLDANPVVAGITYLEGDLGSDSSPDYFEVTFEGGSPTTLLTQFVISGDQDGNGVVSDGDMIFDVNSTGPGAGGFHPFQFDATRSLGLSAGDIMNVTVSDDGLSLIVDVRNFQAGDRLSFALDVDEIERSRVDKIASGVEFETTLFEATFSDEHYHFVRQDVAIDHALAEGGLQRQESGLFYDEYDQLFTHGSQTAGSTLQLWGDQAQNAENRSDGAIDVHHLTPKPISVSGQVFHDVDLDCHRDADESGIGGVTITLERWNQQSGSYEDVATTTTDADGHYKFDTDLGLLPGTYRVVETQPDGYLSVGATPGTVDGVISGGPDVISGHPNILGEIVIPLGNQHAIDYDFCEVRPVSLSGHVYHDADNDGVRDAGEDPIANVLIRVTRIGSAPGMEGPFDAGAITYVRTDAQGFYQVSGLPPGVYEIVEISNDPAGGNPLAAYLDGKDTIGNVAGTDVGVVSNDRFAQVTLNAGDGGVDYDFGELQPVSLNGYVSLTTPEGTCLDPNHPDFRPIAGVTIHLFDGTGAQVATTITNAEGRYEFEGLAPGTYSVVEVQPNGVLDGESHIGTVNGTDVGNATNSNRISNIVLGSGQMGSRYDFCEHEPAMLCGFVWHDMDNDGVRESGEAGIAGVTLELYDAEGQLVRTTTTDAQGAYCFDQLLYGEYSIRELQPAGWVDGQESRGTIAGTPQGETQADRFAGLVVLGGQSGQNYDFGELKLSQISGFVHTDANGNCLLESIPGEFVLAGVKLQLLDSSGSVVAETTTGANGFYQFDSLLPGEYSIRQVQPQGYFDVGQVVGETAQGAAGPGVSQTANQISQIVIRSGSDLVNYNFCEQAPAEIRGRVWEDGPAFATQDGTVPAGYREQRDGVYQSGTDAPLAGVRMTLWYVEMSEGATFELRPVTLGDVQSGQYGHMAGQADHTAIYVVTDAQGHYQFRGLRPGTYLVLEAQPTGYVDANNLVGSTGGFTFNSPWEVGLAPSEMFGSFTPEQLLDAIGGINVSAGGVSVENNFTEVRVTKLPEQVPYFPPIQPLPGYGNPLPPLPPGWAPPFLYGAQFINPYTLEGGSIVFGADAGGMVAQHSWHLSVINSGEPRGDDLIAQARQGTSSNVSFSDSYHWSREDMHQAHWSLASRQDGEYLLSRDAAQFGMTDGFPMAGDWDGDGKDELGIFWNGYWFIDLNGDRTWDRNDLVAKLGSASDQAVVGDWDGDGKDDIGIFGPEWPRDDEAIPRDPGLPDPANVARFEAKNLPPQLDSAADGARIMRLTSAGQARADVIDHVFRFGNYSDIGVAGDWNGSGIRSVGVFRDGQWWLDVNGNGRLDTTDLQCQFGQSGDLPVVGDFNGDGVDEIAVYRQGTWIVDTDGNRQHDAHDLVFQLGGSEDLPVAGDWDGDGTDEPALFHRTTRARVAERQ